MNTMIQGAFVEIGISPDGLNWHKQEIYIFHKIRPIKISDTKKKLYKLSIDWLHVNLGCQIQVESHPGRLLSFALFMSADLSVS